MNSRTTRSFREAFQALPPDVKARARAVYGVRIRICQGCASSEWGMKFQFGLVAIIVRSVFCKETSCLGKHHAE
jgi:hypothetical protein